MRARLLSTLILAAAACGNTLVDHSADPSLLSGGACGAGFASCLGACVPEDAGHCGDACLACGGTAPFANGVPACVARACGFACEDGFLSVGGACARATAVSAGFGHTCAIADGKVKCWGANDHGQLGDGSTTDRASPVDVTLPGAASAIAAGYVHTCAVVERSAVYCWGDNSTGALGDGSTTPRVQPVQVAGAAALAGITAIAAGGGENSGTFYGHTCVISAGAVWCWGGNDSGQLGDGSQLVDGTFAKELAPVKTVDLRGQATSLAVGDRHTCAVDAGAASCWGANGSGQLGDGSITNSSRPRQALAAATRVAAGAAHSCATAIDGLHCWGANTSGQADGGDNATGTFPKEHAVTLPAPPAPMGFVAASAAGGAEHTCAVGTGGTVVCFGANNVSQLSSPATARNLVTVPIDAASAVTAGFAHSCALLSDGGIKCWGANDHGQLGTGSASGPAAAPDYVAGG